MQDKMAVGLLICRRDSFRFADDSKYFKQTYPMMMKGKPACQNIYIAEVLWEPAPSSPVAENRPGNIAEYEAVMAAVNE
jgi:hypothetical protein